MTGETQTMRKGLSKRTRFEVFKRDGFVCQYCGAHPPKVILECDHINPVAEGGSDDMDNLVTACFACNRGKSAVLLSDVPQSLEFRAAATAEREAQIAGFEAVMRAKRERLGADAMEVFGAFLDHFTGATRFPESDFQSIKRFVDALGVTEVLEAASSAMAKQPYNLRPSFKYFCGICWNKIRENEGIARS